MEKKFAIASRLTCVATIILFLSYFWWQTSQHVGANLRPVLQKLNSLLPRQQVADTDEQFIVSTHKQLQLAVCDLSRNLITWKLEYFCRAMLCISAAYAVMQWLSVCVSVTFVDHVKTNKCIFKFFHRSVANPF